MLNKKNKELVDQICTFSKNRVVDDKCFNDISHGKSFEKYINLHYDIVSWERISMEKSFMISKRETILN